MEKVYKCCICHSILKDEKPIRLVKQVYGAGKYKQFTSVESFDICYNCYRIFDKWINKHKEGVK